MVAVVNIISRRGLFIDVHCRSQPNKSKLALYKVLIHINSCLKLLYICNKLELFRYKGGCSMCECIHINTLKGRTDLGYK